MSTHYATYFTALCTALASAYVSAVVRSFGSTDCAAFISTECNAVNAAVFETLYTTVDAS